MNRNTIAAGLMALMLSLTARAEPVIPAGGDCGLARDPLRCQALQKARGACKEKRGSARQKCVQEKLPAPDCTRDKDRIRCEARHVAQEACKGKTGKEKRSCLRDLELAGGARVPVTK